jgi:hypothetical protein
MSQQNRIPPEAWAALDQSRSATNNIPPTAGAEEPVKELPEWLQRAFRAIVDARDGLHDRVEALVVALNCALLSGDATGVKEFAQSVAAIGLIPFNLIWLVEKNLQNTMRPLHLDKRNEQPVYHQCSTPVSQAYACGGADLFSVAIAETGAGFWLRPEGDVGTGVLAVIDQQGSRSYYSVTVTGSETDDRDPSFGQE